MVHRWDGVWLDGVGGAGRPSPGYQRAAPCGVSVATSPTPVSAGPPSWLVPVLVVGLAVGAVSACIGHPDLVIGDGVDLFGTFWFYWFIGDCIEHLRDPSFTVLMFHPLGKEIFAHTGDNFVDAVAAQPFRLLFGFPRYRSEEHTRSDV